MDTRVSSGISGLDEVLHGGFVPKRNYLISGDPGVGKTLLGFHFLSEGARLGQRSMFINLGPVEDDVRRDAEQLGIDLEGVKFLDLSPASDFFTENRMYDIFTSVDVERGEFTGAISQSILDYAPERVFVDPLTQFRYLSPDQFQFREQVLSFLQFLKEQGCTVLFTSQATRNAPDDDLRFIADANIILSAESDIRQLEVTKFRGSDYEPGPHTIEITNEGMSVYSLLRPAAFHVDYEPDLMASGNERLDGMLNGGLEQGTVTLISGPTGTGKTTVATRFVYEAALRGQPSAIYLFEESELTFLHRCRSIDMDLTPHMESGLITVTAIDPMEHASEQFARHLRQDIEDRDTKIVVIDGIDGYLTSIKGEERHLVRRLHALGVYLRNVGVTTIVTASVSDITGPFAVTDASASYVADNVIFLLYVEVNGELHRAIGVLKKRASSFEPVIREMEVTEDGLHIGQALRGLQGVLEGVPTVTAQELVPDTMSGTYRGRD